MARKVFLNGSIYTLVSKDALIEQFRLHPEDWVRALVWDGAIILCLREGWLRSNISTAEHLEAWDNTLRILEEALNINTKELDELIETPTENHFTAVRRLLMKKAGKG